LDQWDSANLIVSLVPALLAVAGLYMVNTVVGFVAEWRASNHLRNTFSQYVPPEFAKRMSESGQKVNLEGEMRELSVLFSDIRNFTGIAENLSPKELTLLMNDMLTAQSEVIHKHSGTVDKYIGDAVMAFWNAPLADSKHAVNAVLAALDMQAAIRQLSEQIQSEGRPPMRLGVGIATGETNVGNMGSKLRMTYTAIGDNVNIASRVEGLTKFYRVPVLVADGTREQCQDSDIIFRVVDMVRVKGRERPLTLYQPMGAGQTITPATQERVKACEQIWKLYLAGNFAEALNALSRIKDWQKDGLLAVYEERLQTLVKNPPEQWDGVFTHMEK
jgi:adenylate cyclase